MCIVEARLTQRVDQQIRRRSALGTARDAAADRVGETLQEGMSAAACHRRRDDPVDAIIRAGRGLRRRGRRAQTKGACQQDADPETSVPSVRCILAQTS